jgi:predicted nucleotidyltransferase component of viral defense system
LKNKLSSEQIYETYDLHELKSVDLIEKDWYVTKALSALTAINDNPKQKIKLVFGGGTALSRAYEIVHRMSEDIDFKIISEDLLKPAQLRQFRNYVADILKNAGFEFDTNDEKFCISRNKSQYIKFTLPYPKIVESTGVLRPEIQIELSVYPMRRPMVEKKVQSFVAAAFNYEPEVPLINCSSVVEIAAEKFVALTRRAGAEQSDPSFERDETIVRHIYDLHVIREHYNFEELILLAKEVMVDDADTRGGKFPAYRENPIEQTILAINGLENDHYYAERFAEFHKAMVYTEETVNFEQAMSTMKKLLVILEREAASKD